MATLTVGTGGTYSTLAAAQTAASDGDVLEIQPGAYSGAGWADFTCSKVLTITDVDDGSITDTSGSCITLQANGSKWLASRTEIISSSTGTAFNVTGIGCHVDGWVTNTNASGEALVVASGATGGDYQIQAANTSGASGSFGIKIAATGDPGSIHDCVLDGYEYGIEYTGAAQTSHYIRRCKILGGVRGISNPYKATIVNCIIDGATTGSYAGLDVKVWNCTFQDCTTAINATASTQYLEIKNNIFDGCTTALKGSAGAEAAPDTNCYFDCGTKYDGYEADVNEITSDPGLDVDYIPAEGSGVLDVGLDLGYADDLYHTSGWRPQGSGYDLGAVEREEVDPPPAPPGSAVKIVAADQASLVSIDASWALAGAGAMQTETVAVAWPYDIHTALAAVVAMIASHGTEPIADLAGSYRADGTALLTSASKFRLVCAALNIDHADASERATQHAGSAPPVGSLWMTYPLAAGYGDAAYTQADTTFGSRTLASDTVTRPYAYHVATPGGPIQRRAMRVRLAGYADLEAHDQWLVDYGMQGPATWYDQDGAVICAGSWYGPDTIRHRQVVEPWQIWTADWIVTVLEA
jgi:hypothetical protein